jgi:regulator of sigma E protease
MQAILANILPFLALLLGFGFLIFVHELGHFLVAKWVGVRCTQFAIGFGHSILTYRKGIGIRAGTTEPECERRARRLLRDEGVDLDSLSEVRRQQRLFEAADRLGLGETEYRLNWMPLGGYVKMLGQEDMDPTARSEDPRAFNRKPVWARAAVISAGVTMNLIFGLIFFVIAFMAGVKFPPAIVGNTVPGSPAATTFALGHEDEPAYLGLQPGDRVVAVDGSETTDFMDIALGAALASRTQTVLLTVERDGQPKPLTYALKPVQSSIGGGRLLTIGVQPPISLTVGQSVDGIPELPALASAGVGPGYRVTEVDGQPVLRYDQYADAIEARQGQPVRVTFVHDATQSVRHVELEAVPWLTTGEERSPHLLGLTPVLAVGAPAPGSRAAKAGLQPGDVFAQLDDAAWPSLDRGVAIIRAAAKRAIDITVLRDGERVTLTPVSPDRQGRLGFTTALAIDVPIIGGVLPNSPAAVLELNPGSTIVAINDQPVATWADMQRLLVGLAADHPEGGTLRLTARRNLPGEPLVTDDIAFSAADARALAGAVWMAPTSMFEDLRVPISAATPWAATRMGFHKTKQFMLQTYMTLLRLFQRTVPVQELRGPVGIFHIGTQTAQQGWTYLLFFLGLISVNLVVINFLPIPIVDGGLMVFLIIEKIKGSPVHPAVLSAANWVGLALIGSIMLMTLYFDISRLLPQ